MTERTGSAEDHDLTGTVKVSGAGARVELDVAGQLELRTDRTFTLTLDGDVSSGIWLQERNRITLLADPPPTATELVQFLEQEISAAVGFAVELTAVREQGRITLNNKGEIRMTSRVQFTFRPGLRGNSPLRLREQIRLRGVPVP